jgi:hypothetical protein
MNSRSFPRRRLAAAICGILLASALGAATSPPTLQSAQEAIDRGDLAQAAEIYEAIGSGGESIEAEIGMVRTALQRGEFRKAVSDANHTASENLESTEAAAILAYLLDRTGRTEQALSSLQKLESQRPQEWIAFAAHAEILIDRLDPRQALTIVDAALENQKPSKPPELLRLAARARSAMAVEEEEWGKARRRASPRQSTWIAVSSEVLPIAPGDIAAAGNGVVIDEGKAVLTDASLFNASRGKAWVRNGVGQVRSAAIERVDGEPQNMVRLRLDQPFPVVAATQVAGPESTRFCFVFAFGAPGNPDPAFPAITPGMVVRADTGIGGLMQITSALGAGHNGAAVFDPRGRLLGMAIAPGNRVLAGKEDVRKALGNSSVAFRVDRLLSAAKVPPATGPQPPMPSVEELYEKLAPAVVQVIALK